MDLQTLKNQFAKEQGYTDWEQLDMLSGRKEINEHIDEICIRAQKEALEKAAENSLLLIKLPSGESRTQETAYLPERDINIIVDRSSITNPENLIL